MSHVCVVFAGPAHDFFCEFMLLLWLLLGEAMLFLRGQSMMFLPCQSMLVLRGQIMLSLRGESML